MQLINFGMNNSLIIGDTYFFSFLKIVLLVTVGPEKKNVAGPGPSIIKEKKRRAHSTESQTLRLGKLASWFNQYDLQFTIT